MPTAGAKADMRTEISDVLSKLESVRSREGFADTLQSACQSLGFDKYTYFSGSADSIARSALTDAIEDIIYLTNLPADWIEHYVKENYSTVDPVIRDAFKARLPISWTEDYRLETLSAEEAQMMADAHDFGIERGLVVPIHGPTGEIGMLCLHSELPDSDFSSLVDSSKHDIHLLAHYAHATAQAKLHETALPKPIVLTDREVEILRWTADGKTAWEIGSILNISERTVNFHLQNAMGKFGVHNKTHAAAKAVSYGLLSS